MVQLSFVTPLVYRLLSERKSDCHPDWIRGNALRVDSVFWEDRFSRGYDAVKRWRSPTLDWRIALDHAGFWREPDDSIFCMFAIDWLL